MSGRSRTAPGLTALAYVFLGLTTVVVAFPYLWMVATSVKPIEEFFTYPLQWLPAAPTARHYLAVLEDSRFLRALLNSTIVATVVTAISIALAVPAAYGLVRLAGQRGRPMLIAILSAQFFPPMIFFIPFYILLAQVKLLNTLTGLVFAYLSVTLPICTWMVATSLRALPRELEEAARIDGCSDVQIIWRIVLPIARPGIITAGIFAFVLAWQEYIFALLYTTTPAAQTAPVLMFYYLGQHQIDYGRLMAASVLLSLPIALPFAIIQRHYRQGRNEGGVKG
ncbi:multiple sugar transport system permease protein/raffinose/stachyose/melibiose transport system permease protein/trehalose/maltose transport system permease protein [Stella humosa]|uniref:Multiple sugar transport system permease protein/raffinose/stachyose/melibiose transport system permease protein/trehalose/maltose transport system permease protein n=1 Tax=Stella humosa TaxID=94 RepID=A0A3N1KPN2_9PROT|nr:carbohydrate ABC transporter permease [Stella humosa]ROP81252.1 multiple sugar transport system permease protein/raffinose/stachyose/melibiose transport system permease protein/trehalose/maltose transport system permease protein [Stella humosa]BBK32600.1 sugar ABC transporter permease [Stella humosa]